MHPYKKYFYAKRTFRIFSPAWVGGSEYCVQDTPLEVFEPKWIGTAEFCVQD